MDLIKDRIEEKAIANTARVIREVAADIVGVVEAEDRLTLGASPTPCSATRSRRIRCTRTSW